ncbi:MAG: zinc-binding dehydrogenase [Planctomycetota bacterium]
MPSRIVFTGKQQVHYEPVTLPAPAAGEVLSRALYTLMSIGTENIVFNRLFESGSHFDNWVKYPFYPGYSTVAEVVAVGEGVTDFKPGDRVAHRGKHASHHITKAMHLVPVPVGIAPEQAAWWALAKIAFVGARAAEYLLGDTVLVIGAGPIGQMSLRWAVAAGAAHVVVVDPMANRLEFAKRGGATRTFSCPLNELKEPLMAELGGELPRVVVDSTGHNAVFAEALGLARPRGRLVLIGDTGTPTQQHLTGAVITQGLTIVGAHDCHNDNGWNDLAVGKYFLRMVKSGRFNMDDMITHKFAPADCAKAYATVNAARGTAMGVVFDWSKAE